MATPPAPMLKPILDSEMRFEDPQFPQLASEERYDNLIKETLNTISTNEGTNNLNLVKSKKAKKIIKNPYDMVGYFGRYLVPEKPPTKMTIREVIDFGRKLVNATQNKKDSKGKKLQPTSAMGKYQFLANSYVRQDPDNEGVLEEFANKLGLDLDTQLFTPEIQDAIAIRMIEERVPSLKDFAMSETDENIDKVIDELNGTWRGIADSEGKTSKGQNVGKLSAEEIKNKLINIKQDPGEYGVGSDVDDTERMLKEEKVEEPTEEPVVEDMTLTTEEIETSLSEPSTEKDLPPRDVEGSIDVGEFIANLFNSKSLSADDDRPLEEEAEEPEKEKEPKDPVGEDMDIEKPHDGSPEKLLKDGGEVEADFVDDDKEDDAADPPPGATPEQVADDIPAMLSEGEYVLPANVVNYLGLKNITEMHQAVLDEIQQMADLGFVENVDENGKPEDDDDEMPKVKKNGDVESPDDMEEGATLIIASASPKGMMCPEPKMLAVGGVSGADDTSENPNAAEDGSGGVGADGSPDDPSATTGPGATQNDPTSNDKGFDPFGVDVFDTVDIATANKARSYGITPEQLEKQEDIAGFVEAVAEARHANNPTNAQMGLNAQTEQGFQTANPGITQGVGIAAGLMSGISPAIAAAIALGDVVNSATGRQTTAEMAGIGDVFGGITDVFGGVSSGLSETASGLVDSLSEIADKVPGTPDETRDEPSGQEATDGEAKTIGEKEKKQEVTKEVAGLMSEYEFIPGVGFVLKSNVVST